jgi:hypothetical protein
LNGNLNHEFGRQNRKRKIRLEKKENRNCCAWAQVLYFGPVTKTHFTAHHWRPASTSGPVLSLTESCGPNSTPRRRHPVPRCQPPRRPSLSRRLLPLPVGPRGQTHPGQRSSVHVGGAPKASGRSRMPAMLLLNHPPRAIKASGRVPFLRFLSSRPPSFAVGREIPEKGKYAAAVGDWLPASVDPRRLVGAPAEPPWEASVVFAGEKAGRSCTNCSPEHFTAAKPLPCRGPGSPHSHLR